MGLALARRDAEALDWLDRLLDLPAPERALAIAALADRPVSLQAQVNRLLLAADGTGGSQALAIGGALPSCEAPSAAAGDLIGAWRLLRELGRGGMSTVWLAERCDGTLQRHVALKMPLCRIDTPTRAERFARERDVLARLSHPHIARLYDAGVAATGQPYIVLEHVQGVAIDRHCQAAGLSLSGRITLFLQVLAAVADAHAHLVVHRDLKPSNILVDVHGQVKLLDFGIAKLMSQALPDGDVAQLDLTQLDGPVLTPRYAAPEQLTNQPVSTATDVYALGTVLYELLTGRLPCQGNDASLGQIVDSVLNTAPLRPSLAVADVAAAASRGLGGVRAQQAALRGDLDTVLLKALRKAPEDRYRTVDAFAEDLRRWLNHLPVQARQPSWSYRCRLFVRRHRAASAASLVGACGVAVFAALAFQQHVQSQAHDLRASLVRDFMFDLVDDAEPDEAHPGADVTGRQMVAGAVQRAQRTFTDRPRLQGELLGELARMQQRLGEGDSANVLIGQANALLERSAPADDAALNRTRVQLAELALARKDPARAGALARAAHAACSSQGTDCAKVRAYANDLQARLALREGRPGEALAQAQQSVINTRLGFGAEHAEVALAYHGLAVMARDLGRLTLAQEALAQALSLAGQLTLRRADRLEMSRTQALLDLDLGRYDAARTALAGLVPQVPSGAERALLLRLQAQALLALGLPVEARAQADAALALSPRDGGTAERLFARQARAMALGLAGQSGDALAAMDEVRAGLVQVGYSANAKAGLRARRLRAELQLRAGDTPAALAELQALAGQPGLAADRAPLERAQTLEALGVALHAMGQVNDAADAHRQAAGLLAAQLPTDHPWRTRNALYSASVALAAAPGEATQSAWRALWRRYAALFAPESVWRHSLERCMAEADQVPGVQRPTCAVLL